MSIEGDINEERMDSLLVGQKNEILKLINGGGHAGLVMAKGILQLLLPLWTAFGYKYKHDELMNRVYEREASKDD